MGYARGVFALALGLGSLGCGDEDDRFYETDMVTENGPAVGQDVACTEDGDCATGEVCMQQICQMQRCTETVATTAPLGQHRYLRLDREVAIVGDNTYVDGFETADGAYLSSWEPGAKVLDVAGGDLDGKRPHRIAVAIEGSTTVRIQTGGGLDKLDVGLVPIAIDAGDVDNDGMDELVALSKAGAIAVCDVDTRSCQKASIDGVEGKDVAVADVDRDGFAEVVLLVKSDTHEIVVWNLDAAQTKQEESLAWSLNFGVKAMAAGDLYDDGEAEVVLLEDTGWFDLKDDKLHLFSVPAGDFVGSKGINGHSIDVAVGDRNGDGKSEIAVLRSEHKFELFKSPDPATIESIAVHDIPLGGSQNRIAMIDWNGDSPAGTLLEGPKLVPGEVVPVAVMVLPPYSLHSKGHGSVYVGNKETEAETTTTSVALSVGLTIGYGTDLGIGPVKVSASLTASLSRTLSRSYSVNSFKDVVQGYALTGDPETYGNDYAGVVLSCGCFDQYIYDLDDPAGKLSETRTTIHILVPTGGESQLWTTKRYNALARALGTLPSVEMPSRIGDVKSYPAQIQTLGGEAVVSDDMVFTNLPKVVAAEAGVTNWAMTTGGSETNAVATSTAVGVSSSLGAFGVTVGSNITWSWGESYALTIAKETTFAGSVPALPDKTETPEDEYLLYRYGFTPFVYRDHYQNAAGEDAGYYVINYSVGE